MIVRQEMSSGGEAVPNEAERVSVQALPEDDTNLVLDALPPAARSPASPKSADAFRTISEVAEDLDVPQHVLRFWETRFPQIRPLKRGGGRRYYRPEDVDLLKGIRHLLYSRGFTIKGAQRIIKEEGARSVQALGRGERVLAAEPRPEDGEPEISASSAQVVPLPIEGGPSGGGASAAHELTMVQTPGSLPPADRARLLSVLDDLRACRTLLEALRTE